MVIKYIFPGLSKTYFKFLFSLRNLSRSESFQYGTYTKDNTPISFTNRIAYGFTKNDVAEKHIDNVFWVSKITNYSQKSAVDNVKEKSKCYGVKITEGVKQFKIGGPNQFYITESYSGGSTYGTGTIFK